MRPYSPGGALNVFTSARSPSETPEPSAHCLRRGLPGYLIPFAPHAFASQRQSGPATRFRHGRSSRYLRISPLHLEFQLPLPASSLPVRLAVPRLSRGISHDAWQAAYTRFKPSDSEQRSPPPYYRGCWHGVSRGFLWGCSTSAIIHCGCLLTPDSSLHPEGLHPARGVAGSDLRPLTNIRCCSHP